MLRHFGSQTLVELYGCSVNKRTVRDVRGGACLFPLVSVGSREFWRRVVESSVDLFDPLRFALEADARARQFSKIADVNFRSESFVEAADRRARNKYPLRVTYSNNVLKLSSRALLVHSN